MARATRWEADTCTSNFLTRRVSGRGHWSSQNQRRRRHVAGGEARLSAAQIHGPRHLHPRAVVLSVLPAGLVACAEVVQAIGSHSRAVPDPAPGLSLSLNSPCRLQARARPRRSRRWRPCRKCPPPKASWLTSATCSAGPRRLERPCCAAQWRRTRRMPILWSRHSSPQETRPGTMPPPAYRSICHRHGCEATQLPARRAFSTMALATRAPTPDCALPSRS